MKLHRVVIPKTIEERQKSRYSFAYFIAPDNQTIIRPLKSEIIPDTNNRTRECDDLATVKTEDVRIKTFTAYEHIMERVNTAYGVKVSK